MRRSKALAAALVAAVLTVSGVAVAITRSGGDDRGPGSNAQRFLALTGDGTRPAAVDDEERAGGAAAAGGAGAAAAPSDATEGERLPNGWRLRPAGRRTDVLRFPLGIAADATGDRIVVSSDNGGAQALSVIDSASGAAVPTTASNLFMGVTVKGDVVYASGGNANRVFRFRLAGPAPVGQDPVGNQPIPVHAKGDALVSALPAGDGIKVSGYPGNSVLVGDRLFVAGTLSEPTGKDADACPRARKACARVTVIDTANDTVVGSARVGLDAYDVKPSADGKWLFVSNWADEAATPNKKGTVSVVGIDPADTASYLREVTAVAVGHHPSALAVNGDRLFVANTNDDSISVLDVSRPTNPVPAGPAVKVAANGAEVGAHPVAFALSSDGARLYVALAGLNAVEVLDGHSAARSPEGPRYIPTDWYPAALALTKTATGDRLWVANAKGKGPGPGGNGSVFSNGFNTDGSVTAVDLPSDTAQRDALLDVWTQRTVANDGLGEVTKPCVAPDPNTPVSEVLCPPAGQASPVKHVVYIVTENKTFDQYFGDINQTSTHFGGQFDADPAWTLYGQQFTPNHHALADRWSLGDNFFSDAEVSVTGHSWTSGGIATDHNERTWPADYDEGIRGTHGGGDPHRAGIGDADKTIAEGDAELQDPEDGYIFEALLDHGFVPPSQRAAGSKAMAIYGEGVSREKETQLAPFQAPHWKDGDIHYFDTCRAQQFVSGVSPAGPGPSPGELGAPSLPLMGPPTLRDCEGRTLDPNFTLKQWIADAPTMGDDAMPAFIYMSLPVNHTLGSNLGNPTPGSMVADNDYAIGLIVDALSRSPFWGSTVVIQTEDDTQVAGDHVSALRDYVQVVGPWAKPGPNHQRGSMPSILRTIEQLFGVAPFSLYDSKASPLHGAFVTHLGDARDTGQYTAIKPNVPFAVNGPGAPGQAASMAMDWSTYDRIDEQTLNAILYAVGKGWPLRLPAYADNGGRFR